MRDLHQHFALLGIVIKRYGDAEMQIVGMADVIHLIQPHGKCQGLAGDIDRLTAQCFKLAIYFLRISTEAWPH